MAKSKKPADTTTKKARRARGLVRVEVWIDPVIAATLEALRTKRNETSAQTVRAALLLLFQMTTGFNAFTAYTPGKASPTPAPRRNGYPEGSPEYEKIKTSSTYGKTAADIAADAMARGVSSGMATALGTNGRGAAKIQPSKGKCKRCGFVACACIGGVKR